MFTPNLKLSFVLVILTSVDRSSRRIETNILNHLEQWFLPALWEMPITFQKANDGEYIIRTGM
jgi:hypothetical protein